MFAVGQIVVLNVKGVNHVIDTFGSFSGMGDPWTVMKSSSSLATTYTLLNQRGTRFEGVKEDFLSPASYINRRQLEGASSDSE